jgi:uncharacterized protein (TIGR01244 family)
MTQPKRLSDRLSVTPQVLPADLQTLANAGFRSIISNRPNREGQDQSGWAAIERAARDAGMEARHIPVTPGAITADAAARFATALDELPEPVVGFCRTVTRSVTLWTLANADKRSPEEFFAAAADAGYDIAPLRDGFARD